MRVRRSLHGVILTDLTGDSGRLRLQFSKFSRELHSNLLPVYDILHQDFNHYLWRWIRETNEPNYRRNFCDCYWSSVYPVSESILRYLFSLWVFSRSLSQCMVPNHLMLYADDWEDAATPLQIFDHHSCSSVYHFSQNDEIIKCSKAFLEKPDNQMIAWRDTHTSVGTQANTSTAVKNKDNYFCRECLITLQFRTQPFPSHFIALLKIRSLMY